MSLRNSIFTYKVKGDRVLFYVDGEYALISKLENKPKREKGEASVSANGRREIKVFSEDKALLFTTKVGL